MEVRKLIKSKIESFSTKGTCYLGIAVKYVDEKLPVKKMFELFNEETPEENTGYTFYHNFFKEHFKLDFGRPQIDGCCTCELHNLKTKSPHFKLIVIVLYRSQTGFAYNQLQKILQQNAGRS